MPTDPRRTQALSPAFLLSVKGHRKVSRTLRSQQKHNCKRAEDVGQNAVTELITWTSFEGIKEREKNAGILILLALHTSETTVLYLNVLHFPYTATSLSCQQFMVAFIISVTLSLYVRYGNQRI